MRLQSRESTRQFSHSRCVPRRELIFIREILTRTGDGTSARDVNRAVIDTKGILARDLDRKYSLEKSPTFGKFSLKNTFKRHSPGLPFNFFSRQRRRSMRDTRRESARFTLLAEVLVAEGSRRPVFPRRAPLVWRPGFGTNLYIPPGGGPWMSIGDPATQGPGSRWYRG